MSFRRQSILPGFGLSLGYAVAYLSLIVLIPLAALVLRSTSLGLGGILASASEPRVFSALRVSFGLSLAAAAINVVFGVIIAWVLVRYEFFGRKFLDAIVDLPLSLIHI